MKLNRNDSSVVHNLFEGPELDERYLHDVSFHQLRTFLWLGATLFEGHHGSRQAQANFEAQARQNALDFRQIISFILDAVWQRHDASSTTSNVSSTATGISDANLLDLATNALETSHVSSMFL